MRYTPATKGADDVRQHPPPSAAMPGGIGLATAMAMLKSGWVIVGSLLREDGTTATKGPGCLVVLDS